MRVGQGMRPLTAGPIIGDYHHVGNTFDEHTNNVMKCIHKTRETRSPLPTRGKVFMYSKSDEVDHGCKEGNLEDTDFRALGQ